MINCDDFMCKFKNYFKCDFEPRDVSENKELCKKEQHLVDVRVKYF